MVSVRSRKGIAMTTFQCFIKVQSDSCFFKGINTSFLFWNNKRETWNRKTEKKVVKQKLRIKFFLSCFEIQINHRIINLTWAYYKKTYTKQIQRFWFHQNLNWSIVCVTIEFPFLTPWIYTTTPGNADELAHVLWRIAPRVQCNALPTHLLTVCDRYIS